MAGRVVLTDADRTMKLYNVLYGHDAHEWHAMCLAKTDGVIPGAI